MIQTDSSRRSVYYKSIDSGNKAFVREQDCAKDQCGLNNEKENVRVRLSEHHAIRSVRRPGAQEDKIGIRSRKMEKRSLKREEGFTFVSA